MKFFKKNIKIKNLILPNNIIIAPLAEYTDFPFRRLLRNYTKSLIYTEMIKMEALLREKHSKILKYTEDMRPIGAQLCGANSSIVQDATKKIEDLGFDIVDLNCGCPVYKVVKDGSGSALLKSPNLIYEMLYTMVRAVNIPVSVKIRLGWDEGSIVAKDLVKIAIDAGVSAITIHGRTKKQGYSGKANWDYIRECKEVAKKNILVFGNGDLYKVDDVKNIFEETACDGIMLARGILANPNLPNEIENFYNEADIEDDQKSDLENTKKRFFDRRESLLKYIEYVLEEKGSKAIYDLRRISGWFLRDIKNIKHLRIDINKTTCIKEAISLIEGFNW